MSKAQKVLSPKDKKTQGEPKTTTAVKAKKGVQMVVAKEKVKEKEEHTASKSMQDIVICTKN